MEGKNNVMSTMRKVLKLVELLACLVLLVVVLVNVTLIVKSYLFPDKVPDFFGYKPFIVLSGSMEPEILAGDIIIVKQIAPEDIAEGDVISFRTDKDVVVSHRVTEVKTEGGLSFQTKGDANAGMDAESVSPDNIEGIYILRIAMLGDFALFLQTPIGMLLFVITPLCLFILYDIVSRSMRTKKKRSRELELEAELAALKAAMKEDGGEMRDDIPFDVQELALKASGKESNDNPSQ